MAATELRQRHNPSRRMALQLFVFYIRSEKKCGLLRLQEKALSDLIWYDDRDLSDSEYSELFLSAEDNWRPVLK